MIQVSGLTLQVLGTKNMHGSAYFWNTPATSCCRTPGNQLLPGVPSLVVVLYVVFYRALLYFFGAEESAIHARRRRVAST